MAIPSEKDCKNAYKKLQDYLPEGTSVRIDLVDLVDTEKGIYHIVGGYVVGKFFDPKTVFVLMCTDPIGVVLLGDSKVLVMHSLGGAVQWIIDSFKEGVFKMESSEIKDVL